MISGGMIRSGDLHLCRAEWRPRGVILDGRVPHACLLELFTDRPGTIIRR